jgi:purine-binding chemotaxis protein CheW
MLDAYASASDRGPRHEEGAASFVTFEVCGQMFGVPVMKVQDILTPDAIAPVPGGPVEVQGLINLRGRIVTVINLRTRLGLGTEGAATCNGMCVTVENEGEFYTLFVDRVGDVVSLPSGLREDMPATLDALWKGITDGVYRTGESLLVILDVGRLLAIRAKS